MDHQMTILVTGGSGGIGFEMARLLAARGHKLVLASRDGAKLEQVASAIGRGSGNEVRTYAIDLAQANAARRLFEFTQSENLTIDALINNAGFGLLDEHVELDLERLQQMLQLNIVTVVELCHLYGGQMKQRRSGRILNVASTAAYQPTPYFAAYGASKAFVLNFSESLAKELEDYGVSVSCLSPGPTDTAFFSSMDSHKVRFDKARRTDPQAVALAGVKLMLGGGLSQTVGFTNRVLIFINRVAPRTLVASISKQMLQPPGIKEKSA